MSENKSKPKPTPLNDRLGQTLTYVNCTNVSLLLQRIAAQCQVISRQACTHILNNLMETLKKSTASPVGSVFDFSTGFITVKRSYNIKDHILKNCEMSADDKTAFFALLWPSMVKDITMDLTRAVGASYNASAGRIEVEYDAGASVRGEYIINVVFSQFLDITTIMTQIEENLASNSSSEKDTVPSQQVTPVPPQVTSVKDNAVHPCGNNLVVKDNAALPQQVSAEKIYEDNLTFLGDSAKNKETMAILADNKLNQKIDTAGHKKNAKDFKDAKKKTSQS